MRSIEVTGRTVEEAVQAALRELAVEREQAEIEVLEEPSKGFLGFLGGKQARVRVTVGETPEKVARDFLGRILEILKLEAKIEVREEEGGLYLTLHGKNLGILIGRRGETLNALQYLLNLIVHKKTNTQVRLILDVEGYRQQREQALVKLARQLSEKVKRTGRKIVLEPMAPHERRIIHMALQADSRVHTFSEGEEPYRKVVISPKPGRK